MKDKLANGCDLVIWPRYMADVITADSKQSLDAVVNGGAKTVNMQLFDWGVDFEKCNLNVE